MKGRNAKSRKQTKNKFIKMVWIKERKKELEGKERRKEGRCVKEVKKDG